MRSFQSIISASLIVALGLTACTNNTTTEETKKNTDTTAAVAETKTDIGTDKLEANKKLVTAFYQAIYVDRDSTSIDKYVADNIKQHNPLLSQDGKQWLKEGLRPFLSNPNLPKGNVEIKQISAEGDMVWVLAKEVAPNGKEFARAEIFRIENGKITENWLVYQQVPAKNENKNGMF